MPRTRRATKSKKLSVSTAQNDEYTYETLPEDRKKRLHSMLEDMDKEIEDRLEAANTETHSICQSVRNAYRVAIFQLPKSQREMNLEELFQLNLKEKAEGLVSTRESLIISSQLAKVAENVTSTVKSKVSAVKKTAKKSNLKESIENNREPGPMTSTAFTNRKCGKVPESLQNISAILPASLETPKPISGTTNRHVLRLAKPNELGLSLNGSPILMALENITPSKETAINSILEASNAPKQDKENAEGTMGTIESAIVDTDMEAYLKVQSLRSKIDDMLKMKD